MPLYMGSMYAFGRSQYALFWKFLFDVNVQNLISSVWSYFSDIFSAFR